MVDWVLFDLNGTLLDPSGVAEPLGGREEDQRLVSEAFHEALLLTMADTLSGGAYRPLPEYLAAALERGLRAAGRDIGPLQDAMERATRMVPFRKRDRRYPSSKAPACTSASLPTARPKQQSAHSTPRACASGRKS